MPDPIYLTAIEPWHTAFRGTRLSDSDSVHKSVSKLFDLPDGSHQVRADNDILWRIEDGRHGPYVLVQSRIPPIVPGLKVREVARGIPRFRPQQVVRFRTKVDAVIRIGNQATPLPQSELVHWLEKRSGLSNIEVVRHLRNKMLVGRKKTSSFSPLVDIVEGVATVSDSDRLANAMLHGIGRSRAFGCGLLTVVPLSSPNNTHY